MPRPRHSARVQPPQIPATTVPGIGSSRPAQTIIPPCLGDPELQIVLAERELVQDGFSVVVLRVAVENLCLHGTHPPDVRL
jgi:hypothetical protein